jgi:hypothetical protein
VATDPVVITADAGTVTGRDPLTGRPRWSYRRDLPLCTVAAAWGRALAVYRTDTGCTEVTSVEATTGARGPTRNADVAADTRLTGDGNLVTATGATLLETWRSDLVRTLEYGRARAPAQPHGQPRPGCVHTSVAVTAGRLGVIERCPGRPHDRLTVLVPDGGEPDHPEEEFSVELPVRGARLIALTDQREAVLLPGPPRLSVRGPDGAEQAVHPLALPPADLAGDPPGGVVPTAAVAGALLWWTGSSTVALDPDDLHPRWTLPGALGPGALLAGTPVLPVPGGLAVVDPAGGRVLRTLPVTRPGWSGPVGLATLGPVLLEQRGPTLVALR